MAVKTTRLGIKSVGQKLVDVLPGTGFGGVGHSLDRQIIAGIKELALGLSITILLRALD